MKAKYIAIAIMLLCCAIIVAAFVCLGTEYFGVSLDYSLAPEGVEANLNGEILLVKYSDSMNVSIYTISDGSVLINFLQFESWTVGSAQPIGSPTIVIRIGEGYEVALYSDGLIFVCNEYSGNDPSDAYYTSNADLSAIAEYLQTNASICDSPWGAFTN